MIGWVNIGILGGLATLAVPIFIHLLRSRNFQIADLGTLRFLREAVEESTRWRRIRDLLLLLLRLLAVALLTCLFARPFFSSTGSVGDRDQETVLLVDASGSMAGRLLGAPAWKQARRRVRDLMNSLPESGKLTVAAFADSVEAIPDWDHFEPVLGGGTDYTAALQWARDRLELSRARHRRLILVTDAQASGLPAVRPSEWPADIPVRLETIPTGGSWNLGIAEVQCKTPYPGEEAIVQVTLAASGAVPDGSMDLVFDYETGEPIRIEVPIASQTVEIRIPGRPGLCKGTARLESDDGYPLDNRRPFAFQLRTPAPVLLVDGDPGSTPFANETYFLAKVLETSRTEDGRSAYAVTRRTAVGDISRHAVVALCNVGAITHNDARSLAEFVNHGGGLVVFLGDRCEHRGYARLHRLGVFPLRIQPKRVAVPSPWRTWNSEHPLLSPFGGPDKGNLSRIVFRDAFEIEVDSPAQVLARLASDMPAMVSHAYGTGRVVVITNPATREWTHWPAERIFLPIIRESFRYAMRAEEASLPLSTRHPAITGTRVPGVYVDERRVEVVVPAAQEIDATRCDETEFRHALALPPESATPWRNETAGLPEGRERNNEVWRWLAVALIAALMIENMLADKRQPG